MTMIRSSTKGVMTLDELKQSPEYIACSDKMKCWLVTLIENGFDYPQATAAAFDCKYPKVFSYAVRNWPKVRAALYLYLGKSERDTELENERTFRKRVDKAASKCNLTVAQIEALKFQGRVHGWDQTGIPRLNGYIPVADRKPEAASPTEAPATSNATSDSRVPAGATALADNNGVIRGYRTADAKYVQLADIEVSR